MLLVWMAGKLNHHREDMTATTVVPQPCSHLLHIKDNISGTEFLVDSGAEISLVKPLPAELRFKNNDYSLVTANGNKITTYGTRTMT